MVSTRIRTEAVHPLPSLTLNSSSSRSTKNSFSQQLVSTIEGSVKHSLNGSERESKVGAAKGQSSGSSQFLAALTPASKSAASTAKSGARAAASVSSISSLSAPAPQMPPADEIPTMLGMGPLPGALPVTCNGSSPAPSAATTFANTPGGEIPTMLGMGPATGTVPLTPTGPSATAPVSLTSIKASMAQAPGTQQLSSPTETEGDAYWAKQPAAVQVLRGMPDDEAKEKLALSLANQGYSIDTQIMVWNWDPQMTMTVRENQGYAWVPSFGQSNIPIGPGLSMPGDPNSYSPNSSPAGSIQVSTAFAIGTIQNPLVRVDPTTT
jgi:hypothetical protein